VGREEDRENQRKHAGISFELAALVFEDGCCLIGLDSVDETGEERWHALGAVQVELNYPAVLLLCMYTGRATMVKKSSASSQRVGLKA
jgi:uncharacterized DUF497 family protein